MLAENLSKKPPILKESTVYIFKRTHLLIYNNNDNDNTTNNNNNILACVFFVCTIF